MKNFTISRPFKNTLFLAAICMGLTPGIGRLVAADSGDSDMTATPAATQSDGASTNTDEAAAAWKIVKKAAIPPPVPEEWSTNAPSEEEQIAFYKPKLLKAADLAKDFYTKYPGSPKADDARKQEIKMLMVLSRQFGDQTQADRLEKLEQQLADSPNATPEDKLAARLSKVRHLGEGLPGTLDELEKAGRALQKDYPDKTIGYQVLMECLDSTTGDQTKALAKELLDGNAPDNIKEAVKGKLKSMEALGKPVDIKFTAVDGREVDISKMSGKVVLVDFWATWCGPCMGELPHVKEAYSKLHDKGFEIVGISLDQDKDALLKTLAEKEMTWPQYFDGKGWQNKYATENGIQSIPTMWLVDKKGLLRDNNGRDDLQGKVEKMLGEN